MAKRAKAVGSALGRVSLVGAGPGDPELLTLRAARRLRDADLVLHDGLVPPAVVALAERAECVAVSRRPGRAQVTQDAVTKRMIDAARAGRDVVRLKAGDPCVLGRGGEEALALVAAGVPVEIVPGLSSAVVAPELAGIPVTHRGVTSGFVVLSGHAEDAYGPVLGALAPESLTLVLLMAFGERGRIAERLLARGWPAETPAAIVTNASQPTSHVWTGRLAGLGEALASAAPADAHTIVIGEVVSVGAVIAAGLQSSSSTRARERHGSSREDVGTGAAVVCA